MNFNYHRAYRTWCVRWLCHLSTPGDFPTFAADLKSRESRARIHARERFSFLPSAFLVSCGIPKDFPGMREEIGGKAPLASSMAQCRLCVYSLR